MKHIVFGVLAFSIAAMPLAEAAGSPAMLVPPSEKVAGLSQSDWSRSWWQWAKSFADHESPVADRKGNRCHLRQEGDVWFLAGTYGSGPVTRECTVPAGKYIFFPLINYVVFPRPGLTPTCELAIAGSARAMNQVSSLLLEIDGKNFENLTAHRQATRQCFDLAELAGGGLAPSAANGYYIMLRPLSRGTHTIIFGGSIPEVSQDITYTLQVE